MSNQIFGDWLNNELNKRHLSQTEFANFVEITQSHLSRIISGTRGATPELLVDIAHALKLPPETVFRAAGILPKKSTKDELIEQIAHLTEQLPEQEQQDILEFIKLRHRLAEEREKNGSQRTATDRTVSP